MIKNSKFVLLTIAFACIGLLGFALYLQTAKGMQPCPWCIIQRYAFVAVALICFTAAFLPPKAMRIGTGLGLVAALAGVGSAGWLLWVKAHPSVSCGIDPLETSLNKIFTAELFPILFKADGLCTTEYAPILGLSVAQWSFAWFLLFSGALLWIVLRRPQQ